MSYELLFGSTTEMATPNELDDQPSYENRASADETKEPYAGTAESTPTPSRAGTFSMSSSNFIDSITQSVTQSVNSLSQTLIPLLSSSSPSSSTTPIPTTTTIQVSSAVNPILNSSASDSSATSSVAGATTQTLIESPEHPFANPFFNTTSPSLIHIPAFSATDRNHDEGNPRASLDSMRSARSAELPHEDELDHDAYDEDEGDTVDGSVRARIGSNGSLEFQDAQGPPDDRIVVERIGKDKPSVNRRASWGTTGERDGRSIMVIEELSVEAQSCADQDFQPTPFTENSDPFAANGGTPNLEPHGRDGCMNERSQLLNRNQRRFQRCFPEIANEATVLGGWYNCAMERDILWQGQVFCTSHYVCFYGKLFAKAVRVMIHFQDIVRIEKMNSLMVIPNALKVVTASKQYVFTSFLGRDTAFAELHGAWWRFRHKGFGNTSTHSLFDGGFRTAISDANAPSNTPATLDTNARQSHRRQRSNSDAAVYMTALSDVTPYADYSTPVTSDPPKSSNTSRLLRAAKESAISIPSFPKRKFNRPRADSEATTNSEGAASGSEDHPQPQASTSTPIKAPKPGARRKHQSLIGIPSSVTALVTQFSAGSGGEEDDKVCKSPDTYNEKDGKGFASLNGKSRAKGSAKANAKSKKDSITQPSSLLDGHGGLDMGSLATAAVAAPPVVTVTQAQAQVSISAQSSNTPAQSPSQDKRAQFGDFMRKAKLSGLGGSGGRPALGFAAAAIAGANSVMTQQQNVFRRQRATQAGRASSESMRAEEVEVQKESKAEDAIDGIDDGEMQDALDLDLSESETETETDITTDDETSLVTRLNVVSATPPPADPVPCACPSHLKHLLGEWVFPIPVAALHALMWGDDMTLVWEPCHIRREIQKSFALCLEEQTIEKDTDFVKVVRTISRQPEVPMGSTFEVSTQTCLTHEGPGRSRMKVTMMLDWKAYNFMAGEFGWICDKQVHRIALQLNYVLSYAR
ncbi:hypothetical protein BC936DRAFT_138217 [Jimgerdemannia flammicorona]|uniref:VASt domain-containing protein n=1 Tax=Jimgerdemannia flammicorona TaxID=994334 RepID=A0A433CVK8_9FUNG|nr:hypothetical protein BC936DRAFT_138217 [Jimgerdemannia flammicorona]